MKAGTMRKLTWLIATLCVLFLFTACTNQNGTGKQAAETPENTVQSGDTGQTGENGSGVDGNVDLNFMPIEQSMLDRFQTEDNEDIWKISFRGFDNTPDKHDVILEASYSPDFPSIFLQAIVWGREDVIECKIDDVAPFVEILDYLRTHGEKFTDGSEFLRGVPGMYTYPEETNETFTVFFNDRWVIARGIAVTDPDPDTVNVINLIRKNLVDPVIAGNCE